MYIKQLTIQNVRCIESIDVALDRHINLLFGENGSGKTSIMVAACFVLSETMSRDWSYECGPDEVRRVRIQDSTGARWEPVSELSVAAILEFDDGAEERIGRTMDSSGQHRSATPLPFGDHIAKFNSFSESADPVTLPIIAYYAPRRGAERDRSSALLPLDGGPRRNAYEEWCNAGSTTEDLERWMLSMALLEFQEGSSLAELDAVRKVGARALPGSSGIEYRQFNKAVTVSYSDGRPPIELHLLSDGERGIVTLIVDIAVRMIRLNPHLGAAALDAPGVVMIDELDVHLHPALQRHALGVLRESFPNVQFMLATHSPSLLGEADDGQLLNLDGGQARPVAGLRGMDVRWITEHEMDAPVRNVEVQHEIDAVRAAIDDGDYSAARAQILQLRAAQPSDPDVTRLFALLTQLERSA